MFKSWLVVQVLADKVAGGAGGVRRNNSSITYGRGNARCGCTQLMTAAAVAVVARRSRGVDGGGSRPSTWWTL